MQTCTFKGLELPKLGFGGMRLPLNEDKSIDEDAVQEMVDHAMAHGVDYFDTAYPYHNGYSEIIISRCLKKYPRDSYFLATKYPGHQIDDEYDPAAVFEEQLKKCDVEYFDFYLLHNVYENSIKTYMDPQWGILDYFIEQKKNGRIKHLGFSTHGMVPTLKRFLDYAGDHMEFAQIQLNYLDWTVQDAKDKCRLLEQAGIPIWVMEPLRGGTLAHLGDEEMSALEKARPGASAADWAFRWLMGKPVDVILSGMSNMEQLETNIAIFDDDRLLTPDEDRLLMQVAESMKDDVPCTGCRYCVNSCPQGLDIPMLLKLYNDMKVEPNFTVSMIIEAFPGEKRPSACTACGSCTKMCPQFIHIPTYMKELAEMMKELPSWEQMSRERAAAAKALRNK